MVLDFPSSRRFLIFQAHVSTRFSKPTNILNFSCWLKSSIFQSCPVFQFSKLTEVSNFSSPRKFFISQARRSYQSLFSTQVERRTTRPVRLLRRRDDFRAKYTCVIRDVESSVENLGEVTDFSVPEASSTYTREDSRAGLRNKACLLDYDHGPFGIPRNPNFGSERGGGVESLSKQSYTVAPRNRIPISDGNW